MDMILSTSHEASSTFTETTELYSHGNTKLTLLPQGALGMCILDLNVICCLTPPSNNEIESLYSISPSISKDDVHQKSESSILSN